MGRLLAVLVLVATVGGGAPATARGPRGGPCADDADRFCAHVPPGPGHMLECLRQHEADLSAGCARVVGRRRAPVPSFHASCGADVARLCSTVSPGRGRILRCLRSHVRDLSKTCQDALVQMRR